jgi:hypothetical protein
MKFRPAICVMLMTLWWAVPAFFIQLQNYQFNKYLSSYIIYYVIFGITLVYGVLLTKDKKAQKWKELSIRQKFFWLCSRYAINIALMLLCVGVLSHFHLLDYFGSDPEGSIGMLFVPSALAYFLPGLLVCFLMDWGKWIRERLTRH